MLICSFSLGFSVGEALPPTSFDFNRNVKNLKKKEKKNQVRGSGANMPTLIRRRSTPFFRVKEKNSVFFFSNLRCKRIKACSRVVIFRTQHERHQQELNNQSHALVGGLRMACHTARPRPLPGEAGESKTPRRLRRLWGLDEFM